MPASKVHNLLGEKLFRDNESIFIHKSSSLPSYIETNHVHDFIEITYVISGECTHIEYNKHFSVKKGDLFIVNYGVPHQNVINKHVSEPYLAYDCAFKPDFIDKALNKEHDFLKLKSSFMFESLFNQIDPNPPNLHLTGGSFYEFEKLMTNMYEEYENQENLLIPGNYVDIRIGLKDAQKVLLVPQSALAQDKNGNYVMTVDRNGNAIEKRVVLGDTIGDQQVVISGLQSDDEVIVQGLQKVRDGMKVRAQLVQSEPEVL